MSKDDHMKEFDLTTVKAGGLLRQCRTKTRGGVYLSQDLGDCRPLSQQASEDVGTV